MAVENDVRTALRGVLTSLSGLPDIAYENRGYRPAGSTPFIRETLLITEEAPCTLGPPTQVEMKGELQLDVCYPLSSGSRTAAEVADQIKQAYYPGLYLNGLVLVDGSGSETAVSDDQFYVKPVRVRWRTYYTTPEPA